MLNNNQISQWVREHDAQVCVQPVLEDYESMVATIKWGNKTVTRESWDMFLAIDLAVEEAAKTK